MAIFIDPNTGKTSQTKEAGYVDLDTYTPGAKTASTAPTAQPSVQPAPAITTSDVYKNNNSIISDIAKKGTFATYDQTTGLATNRRSLNIGEQGQNDFLEMAIPGQDYANNPQNWIITSKNANTLYGFKKPAQTVYPVANAVDGNTGTQQTAETKPLSVLEQKQSIIDNYFTNKTAETEKMKESAGVSTISAKLAEADKISNDLLQKVEKMSTDLELGDILDQEAQISLKNKIEGQPIAMEFINSQLTKGLSDMTQEQRISRLYDVYEINTMINAQNAATRNVQLLQGQYDRAMEGVKSNIEDWTAMQTMKLDLLTEMGQLEKEEKARLEQEIAYERDLGLQGYVHVDSTEAYEKIVKEMGVTASTFSQFFYKDPSNGKIYLKPSTQDKEMEKLLTPTEAKSLGLPYGITRGEAAEMGIIPSNKTVKKVSSAGGGSVKSGDVTSDEYQEGDVIEKNGKFFVYGVDGKWRAATAEEKKQITEYADKGELNDEEKEFAKILSAEQKKLAKGGSWGDSWNYLHNLYPDATNEQLDIMLNKGKYYNN